MTTFRLYRTSSEPNRSTTISFEVAEPEETKPHGELYKLQFVDIDCYEEGVFDNEHWHVHGVIGALASYPTAGQAWEDFQRRVFQLMRKAFPHGTQS